MIKRFASFVISCLLLVTLSGCQPYGKKLDYSKFEVYYTDAVNEADAKKVGDFIDKELKLEGDTKRSLQLDKSGDKYALRFVVKEGVENDQQSIDSFFKPLGRAISQNVLNAKMDVHLCDDSFKTKKVVPLD